MFCSKCGSEIPLGATFCEKCGAQASGQGTVNNTPGYNRPVPMQMRKQKYNTVSIVGLVIAAISLFLNFWGISGIAAVIVSVIGLIQVNQRHENGKALAIVGIVVGAFSVIYGVYSIITLASILTM